MGVAVRGARSGARTNDSPTTPVRTLAATPVPSNGLGHMENEQKPRDYLKRATADLRRSRQRVRDLEEQSGQPVAIVGMGCRFPGGVAGAANPWGRGGGGAGGGTGM